MDRRPDGRSTFVGLEAFSDPVRLDVTGRLVGIPAPVGSILKPGSPRTRSVQRRPFDLAHPRPGQVNRFRPLARDVDPEAVRRMPIWDRFYGPLEVSDQLRMVVYSGRRFVRWVALMREGDGDQRFGRRIASRVDRAAPLVGQAFVQAEAADRAELVASARHVAVLDARGAVEARSDALGAWLSAPRRRRRLAEVVRRFGRDEAPIVGRGWVDGWRVELTRLGSDDGPRWLVEVQPPEPIRRSVASALTARQHEVAELLVVGATYAEIARELGISERTVKFHARRVYDALDVASRTELVHRWDPGS